MSVNEIIQVLRRDAHYFRKSGGGVTLSGGEPLTQWRFAQGIAESVQGAGLGYGDRNDGVRNG